MQQNQPTTRNAFGGIEPTDIPKLGKGFAITDQEPESLGLIGVQSDSIEDLKHERLSPGDITFALEMTVACAISYWVMTYGLGPFVGRDSDFLGGMWAVLATIFVFRGTRAKSMSAGLARLLATCVSFALCFIYLLILPFHPVGMAVLIGAGTVIMMLLGRRDDIVTTGITTAVVMVVVAISPQEAWKQPLLRLLDTIVGIAIGIGLRKASLLFVRN